MENTKTRYNDKNVEETRIPVQDFDCEESVLGSLMAYGGSFNEVSEFLNEDCFTTMVHKDIYKAIVSLSKQGIGIDLVTVYGALKKMDSKVQMYEVADISTKGTFANLQFHVLRLRELSIRRNIWSLGHKMVNAGTSEVDDVNDIKQYVIDGLNNYFDKADNVYTLGDSIESLNEIIKRNLSGSYITGTPTGFRSFDEKGGLQKSDLIIVGGETSQGKALRMDELILTPTGWVKNRDLKIGDEVSSIDGEPSYVQGIYPQGVKDMYRINFSDGRSAVCSGDHLWEVGATTFKSGNRILSTLQIKDMQENSSAFHNRMYVPLYCGKFGVHRSFVIDPYILGVLIGDGCLTRGVVIANCDEFVFEKVKERSILGVVRRKTKDRVDAISLTDGRTGGKSNPYLDELRRLGLYNRHSYDKFIPQEYLDSDYEQRLNLLNGLMDTDGDVDKNGCIHYSTVSKKLAEDVVYLCRSLGYKCSMFSHKSKFRDKEYCVHYRVTIAGENENLVVTLPRRRERIKSRKRVSNCIRSIEFIGREECQCIKVSHSRELFIMKDFVVTHNTSLALCIVSNAIRNNAKVAMYSLEMTRQQLSARLLSSLSGVPSSMILYSSTLTPTELQLIDRARGMLPGNNLYFDDSSTSNIDSILISIRNMKSKYDIDGAVIDYLQIVGVNDKRTTREQQMGDVSRRLKNIAKELNIWVIALSQLSRDSSNPVPNLNRLRDSGQIAEAADVVVFVYRPEYYHRENYPAPFEDAQRFPVLNTAMVDVAKGRNIGTFQFFLNFNKQTTTFYDNDMMDNINLEHLDTDPVEEDAPF